MLQHTPTESQHVRLEGAPHITIPGDGGHEGSGTPTHRVSETKGCSEADFVEEYTTKNLVRNSSVEWREGQVR